MSKTGNHTIDTVVEFLGGRFSLLRPHEWSGKCYEAQIKTCDGAPGVDAPGDTEPEAVHALELKVRECALRVLSDEWEFGE